MRIGCYQCPSPGGDLAKGLAVLEGALAQAQVSGVDMLVMPEVFLPGYNAASAVPPKGWDAACLQVSQLCQKYQTALTVGLPEYVPGGPYNSAFVYGPDGALLASYRKIQLFGAREKALFTPGDRLVRFDYLGTRFGLMICYDIEFPEHARALARAGVEVILTPTANMMPFINVCTIQVPGRAMENAVTIAYANYTAEEGDLSYAGHSVIAGPDGYPLATIGAETGLLVADLPTGACASGIPLSTQLADYRAVSDPQEF